MYLTSYANKEISIIFFSGFILIAISISLALKSDMATGVICLLISLILMIPPLLFFRSPYRKIPKDTSVLVAPADGVIQDINIIEESEENDFFAGKPVIKIGIFLSVFDVHINRAPCDVKVKKRFYQPGKYYDARSKLAGKKNSAMTIFCQGNAGDKNFPVIIKQISGAIARRIVCEIDRGSRVKKGKPFGMIKFGSRTELCLPYDKSFKLQLKEGDRVFAGETIVAKITNSDSKKLV